MRNKHTGNVTEQVLKLWLVTMIVINIAQWRYHDRWGVPDVMMTLEVRPESILQIYLSYWQLCSANNSWLSTLTKGWGRGSVLKLSVSWKILKYRTCRQHMILSLTRHKCLTLAWRTLQKQTAPSAQASLCDRRCVCELHRDVTITKVTKCLIMFTR